MCKRSVRGASEAVREEPAGDADERNGNRSRESCRRCSVAAVGVAVYVLCVYVSE